MSIKIGFSILSYNEPEQLLRLVKTLNAVFGDPPIVCHHNFSQCSLQEALFPKNVRFVHPHIVTGWGNITTPLAALKAFSLLREYDQPDWFFLLSGSDYPVRPAHEIVAELSNAADHHDAYLDNREILYRALPPGQTSQHGFGRPEWISLAYYRYCTFRFWWPRPSRKLLFSRSFPFRKRYVPLKSDTIDRMTRWIQFDRPARIYGGGFWFHAHQKAIDRLLDPSVMAGLARYYHMRPIPEESLFHTALRNQADLKICKDHKRYEDWTGGGAHPKWLDMSDLPKIAASGAYFARKFKDKELLKYVDGTLLRI